MKITNIDTSNITNEIIYDMFFNIQKKDYEEADCIIIFGCHLKNLLDERLDVAINVLNQKNINKVLLTGGVGVQGDFNESEYMKAKMLSNGIVIDNIIIEDKSTTTEENIINSIKILRDNDLIENKKIVLVSTQIYLRRIGMEFKKKLKGSNVEFIYEYPNESIFSYENALNDVEIKERITKEIKKIINFIELGIIDDEEL